MADFCKDCSEKMFGKDFEDLAGLCPEGDLAIVLCEGCEDGDAGQAGIMIYVNSKGARVRAEHTGLFEVPT